jgi:hypothetical protein
MKKTTKWTTSSIMLAALLAAASAIGQTEDSLSKQLANPLADLISVPVQLNYDEDLGVDGDGSAVSINVQPVLPFNLSEDWLAISRTIIPFIDLDDVTGLDEDATGMGDILQSFFFSPASATRSGWIWGVGPAFLLPTATDDMLGSDQWAGGPTAVALKQTGPWTYGLLVNHLWTISGDDKELDVSDARIPIGSQRGGSITLEQNINASYAEPWVSYAAEHGTTYSISAETSYDWDASDWTVPIVLTADHLFMNTPNPISVGVAARYWAESPDGAPDGWSARLQMTFLFPR